MNARAEEISKSSGVNFGGVNFGGDALIVREVLIGTSEE
jgi:hypothetical protein